MNDVAETTRRLAVQAINDKAQEIPIDDIAAHRACLESEYGVGNVWDTKELQKEFEVIGFMAPLCLVQRRLDRVKGSVTFRHSPRFYFDFKRA